MKKNWRNVIRLALSGTLDINTSIRNAEEQHPTKTFTTVVDNRIFYSKKNQKNTIDTNKLCKTIV